LLGSLAAQTVPHETIVIDNDSPGRSVTAACAAYDFAEAVPLDRNAGFSMPMNLGAHRASTGTLVLLNDDCVCDPDFVERLIGPLDPGAGIVMTSGVLRDWRHPELIDSAGMELDRTLLVYDYLNGEPLSVLAGAADPIGPSPKAAAFDRDAFLGVGGFDERLFAYWEDVDLALKLLEAGGVCRLAPDALGVHEHSATLGSGSRGKNYLTGFGRGYVLRKWGVLTPSRLPAVVARDLVILGGQAAIDRTVSGVGGRIRGWRAAEHTHPYPAAIAARGGASPYFRNLQRRLQRRRKLSAPGPG
jgi:GT2 family glycosyltransferase